MNLNYGDIANEEKEGFNFDIRDTTRKFFKMQHFAELCSEIVPVSRLLNNYFIYFHMKLIEFAVCGWRIDSS